MFHVEHFGLAEGPERQPKLALQGLRKDPKAEAEQAHGGRIRRVFS